MKELECGLWSATSKAGKSYYRGSIAINGEEYWVNLFKNNSNNEKAPQLKVYMKPKNAKNDEPVPDFKEIEEDIPF